MDGRAVASGPDDPAPARHSGRRDCVAVARGALDRLRRQTAGQIVALFRLVPHPQRSRSPMVVVDDRATVARGGRRPGRVIHRLRQLFSFMPTQDPLPLQPKAVQLFQTGIPPQVKDDFIFDLLFFF